MKVALSNLPEDKKWELFVIGETIRVYAEFINHGGIDLVFSKVEEQVAKASPDERLQNQRIMGGGDDPCIDTKSVFQGAVISGFGNAAYGGFIGATVGTFTVPVFGTATGAVGGAVFGFATGFISGAIGDLVTQAFFDCLFKDDGGYIIIDENGEPRFISYTFTDKIKITPKEPDFIREKPKGLQK